MSRGFGYLFVRLFLCKYVFIKLFLLCKNLNNNFQLALYFLSNHQEARLNNERDNLQQECEVLEKEEEELSAQVTQLETVERVHSCSEALYFTMIRK